MFIWKHNQLQCNPHAPYIDSEGTKHVRVPADLYEEIPDPTPPADYDPELYFRTEQAEPPYVIYTKRPESQIAEILKSRFVNNIQSLLDETARRYVYDDIKSAVSYAEEPAVEKFQLEGRAFRKWRSLVWEKGYEVLGQVATGMREIPTWDELKAELPALEMPVVQQNPGVINE